VNVNILNWTPRVVLHWVNWRFSAFLCIISYLWAHTIWGMLVNLVFNEKRLFLYVNYKNISWMPSLIPTISVEPCSLQTWTLSHNYRLLLQTLVTFVNKQLMKVNLEVQDIHTQVTSLNSYWKYPHTCDQSKLSFKISTHRWPV